MISPFEQAVPRRRARRLQQSEIVRGRYRFRATTGAELLKRALHERLDGFRADPERVCDLDIRLPTPTPGIQEPPSLDIPAEIRKLAALRDEGLLNDQEFEAKKAELLARL